MRGSRAARWATTATVPVLALLWLAFGPGVLEKSGVGVTDEVPGSKTFAGAWTSVLDEDSPLFTVRLDVLPGARTGERGATVLSATRDTICSGSATVTSRSADTLTLGGFDMRRIGPGVTQGTYDCGLPATMKLVADESNGGILWEPKPRTSVQVDRAVAASAQVPEVFLGDWYDARGILQLTVRPGGAGSLAVHAVDEREGRHCVWEGALLDVLPATIVTSGAHVVREESDEECRSAGVSYRYDLRGAGDSARLIQRSDARSGALELRRKP
ncbi:hypothetical protein ACI2L1_27770 [Streptomyces sp. NPDC019531]|uniref:hypothetical protein n=1 Tax=Streptomyces sp. NPDC019531 TaxID=3365062 RepID=UPI00384CAA34